MTLSIDTAAPASAPALAATRAERASTRLADAATPLIRNCWYVAGGSEDFSRELRERVLLGESVVFFRRENGMPVALQNRCPHRSFPLAQGTLEGDVVRCGYHGLAFDAQGSCVDAPSQNVVPRGLCINQYPVVERGPLVWIWMGDADAADVSLIPDTSWLESPDWTYAKNYINLDANYVGLHENLLDLSHFTFLHPTTLGTPEYARTPFDVEARGDTVRITRFVPESDVPLIYRRTGITGKMSRLTVSDFLTPAIHHASAVMRDLDGDAQAEHDADAAARRREFTIYITHYVTPETASKTHYWFTFARDFGVGDPEITTYMGENALKAFYEDVHALHEITRMHRLDPHAPGLEIHLKSDQAGIAMRRILARLAQGQAS